MRSADYTDEEKRKLGKQEKGNRRLSPYPRFSPITHHLSLFPNRRRLLAFAAAEVIQSGAANATLLLHFNFCDPRRMQRENSLDALAVGNSAHSECFVKSAAFAANHYASEYLDSFLVPFHNPGMNAHAIAHGKLRRVAFLLFFLDGINDLIHKTPLSLPRRSLDEGGPARWTGEHFHSCEVRLQIENRNTGFSRSIVSSMEIR